MTSNADKPPAARVPVDEVDAVVVEVFSDLEFVRRLDGMVTAKAHLSDADLGSVVEEATDELIRQLRAGKRPDDVKAVLFWLAGKRAARLSTRRGAEVSLHDGLAADEPAAEPAAEDLARWRSLVAGIDQQRPRQVWRLLVDAIEADLTVLPAAEIGSRLGVGEEAVRGALSRGRKQLKRLAEAEGLVRLLDDGTVLVDFDNE